MSPRPLAGSRLRRVLALVPWIAEHPGAALEEIAARFGVSEAELEHDLELLPLCGLPPYTPDRLIEVEIVDGHVWIRFAEYFDRPLRLSAEEGLGLLTAGRALLARRQPKACSGHQASRVSRIRRRACRSTSTVGRRFPSHG